MGELKPLRSSFGIVRGGGENLRGGGKDVLDPSRSFDAPPPFGGEVRDEEEKEDCPGPGGAPSGGVDIKVRNSSYEISPD